MQSPVYAFPRRRFRPAAGSDFERRYRRALSVVLDEVGSLVNCDPAAIEIHARFGHLGLDMVALTLLVRRVTAEHDMPLNIADLMRTHQSPHALALAMADCPSR